MFIILLYNTDIEQSTRIGRIVMAVFPKTWELIERFKDHCQSRGWKTSNREDLVKAGNEYHNFLWIQTIHPSTFEKVALNRRSAIRDGSSYRVVDVSYMAWVCSKSPPETLMQKIAKNPKILKGSAIYDLSQAYSGEPVCLKLNETDSEVFQEFEKFLEEDLGVKLKPYQGSLLLRTQV